MAMVLLYGLLSLYFGTCIGMYARVMTAKKISHAFLPSLIAPLFSLYFCIWCYFMRNSEGVGSDAYKLARKHLADVMLLFIVLSARNRKLKLENNQSEKWSNGDIYAGLRAYV